MKSHSARLTVIRGDADLEEIPDIVEPSMHGMVEVMRGCGRGCKFCDVTLRSLRYYPPEKVKKEIEEMITYAGDPNYLLYGTDWPISNMESYLKFMNQLELPEEKKELILWKNAAELFKIDVNKL